MAEREEFALKIITPDRVFYESTASMVEFNTTEGEIGVYQNHIPMTVIISPGILTITGTESKTAALHAGFVEILPESVTILAEIIEWPSEIDVDRAEAAKERAEERLHSQTPETDLMRAETALHRAMARIDVIHQ
ncbi:MAG: ATP synthase F1 subunit epsilon [Lachnospiraceae bacterium]